MMSDWETKKLGILLAQRKEQVLIQRDVEYLLVTISNKGKVRLREKKKGALISANKGYIAKSGDFIYSRLSVHTGAFGIVPPELDQALITGEMPCFVIDKKQVHPNVLTDLIGLPDFLWQLKQLAKGMGRVRIKESMMMDLSVTLPSITEQKKLAENLKIKKCLWNSMENEITHQQTLLKKMRQQILQEAIEGKLTADWRQQNHDVEPASELLSRIQAEKEQLIKDKKIKKQKPLPPIGDEEKPFDLPDGWVWCRLIELSEVNTGATPFTSEPSYYGGGINWMTSGDTGNDYVLTTENRITEKALNQTNCKIFPIETLVVAMYGQGKTRGQITELKIEAATNQACAAIQLYLFSSITNQFIKIHFKKIYDEIRELAQGGAQPNLNMRKIKSTIIALPPLPEQKAIAAKVEKLLALCDQMEIQITASQTYAKQLMQAVLKEAFSHPSG